MEGVLVRFGICMAVVLAPLHEVRADGEAEPEAPAEPPAPAEPEPEPEPEFEGVMLVDGGRVSGTIVEIRHEEAVVVIDESGVSRRIPWDQVASVSRAPVPEESEADEDAPEDPLRVNVELTREATIKVEQLTHFDRSWVDGSRDMVTHSVCQAPCEAVVDRAKGNVLVVGDKHTLKAGVDLDGYRDSVTIRVRPGSAGLFWGSLPCLLFGGMATAGGAMVAIQNRELTLGSGLALGLGVPMLAGGITMMVFARTKAKITATAARSGRRLAGRRAARWRGLGGAMKHARL